MQAFHFWDWCFRRCLWQALSGSLQSANNWAFVAGAAIGAAADLAGYKMIFASGWAGTFASALMGIGSAWVIIFIVRLAVSPFHLWNNGTWVDNRFIFKTPIRVFTTQWMPTDNDSVKSFRCKDVPPNSFVDFQITFAGANGRIWGNMALHRPLVGDTTQYSGRGSIRTNNRQQFWLQCYSLPNTVPVTVYVDFLGWQK